MVFQSDSASKTQDLAKKISRNFLSRGGVIALSGDLGAGKTTFVQGFAKGLGIKDRIISPTFVLIRQHHLNNDQTLFHIDLYRLDAPINIDEIGLTQMWNDPKNIVLVEWAEKIKDQLPKDTFRIDISIVSKNARLITTSDNLKIDLDGS